ncbi:MAG: hypothetical protein L3J43_09580 [Sulfurovum sp.]|nr:hypothetical protein [Sulfurovum sp.]
MKIISKFQDYYDIGIAYGVDEKLRFERVTMDASTKVDELRSVTKIVYKKQSQYYRILCHFNVMLFCGKAYPLVYIKVESISKVNKKFTYKLIDENYCYSEGEVDTYVSGYYKPLSEIKDEYERMGYCNWDNNDFKRYVQKHFTQDFKKTLTLFMLYKKPYFYIESKYWKNEKDVECIGTDTTLLPQLKAYKFTKAVPPMQAFQEISMYLGKLDLAEDNTVTIEDKYLAQAKGFDCYSFKKMPRKKKVKSC